MRVIEGLASSTISSCCHCRIPLHGPIFWRSNDIHHEASRKHLRLRWPLKLHGWTFQWELQDPKMELLYHIRIIRYYKAIFCGDIPIEIPIEHWNSHHFPMKTGPSNSSAQASGGSCWSTGQIPMRKVPVAWEPAKRDVQLHRRSHSSIFSCQNLGLKPVKCQVACYNFCRWFSHVLASSSRGFLSIATFDEQRVILQSFPNLTVSHLQKCF
jgi:hypothetical protein